jgi:RNA recognition motif-containing protein
MDIYIGNLPSDVVANDLRALFEKFGEVTDVRLVMGKSRSKTKNYGFVEMPSQEEAEKAIEEMDGTELKEMTLTVKQANPKKPRSRKSKKKRGRGKRGGKGRRSVYGGEDRNALGNSSRPRWPRR